MEGYGTLQKVVEHYGRLRNIMEGYGTLRKVQEHDGRFQKTVTENSHKVSHKTVTKEVAKKVTESSHRRSHKERKIDIVVSNRNCYIPPHLGLVPSLTMLKVSHNIR